MNKFKLILLFLSAIFLISACARAENVYKSKPDASSNPPAPIDVWYVTKKENQSALLVNPTPKDFSATGGMKEFYDAIWASNMPKEVEVGQKVQVWFEGGINTSYPAVGKAGKVLVLPSPKPDHADLSEDQAIRMALKEISIHILVIKEVKFDEKSDLWTIRYKEGFTTDKVTEEHSIQVPDK